MNTSSNRQFLVFAILVDIATLLLVFFVMPGLATHRPIPPVGTR
ncbi:MAG: hypothetical protein R3C44_03165 [Chloroflexota bacterium]